MMEGIISQLTTKGFDAFIYAKWNYKAKISIFTEKYVSSTRLYSTIATAARIVFVIITWMIFSTKMKENAEDALELGNW